MYIEYVTPQQVADPNYTEFKSKGGNYRPTWVVRTSDWQKVPGHVATDGYHTLSYAWSQSGEMFKKDDGYFGLIDNGHHKITTRVFRSIPYREPDLHRKAGTVNVTYNQLLQQICADFNIQYLWYDKICIDQTNKEQRYGEIKQMHLIYSNACYTLALVPEVNITDRQQFTNVDWESKLTEAKDLALCQMIASQWWKRSWTLEEVMMSTRILVVGRNTHFWSLANIKQDVWKENEALSTTMLGFKNRNVKSINQVLRHAHFRTSSKEHDKIFALANILYGIINIDLDYDIDVQEAVTIFYRKLGEHNLSIMCFGSALWFDGEPQHKMSMSAYKLPSWTGVSGMHCHHAIADVTLDDDGNSYYIDEEMHLRVKCRSLIVRPTEYCNRGVFSNEKRGLQAEENYFKSVNSMDDFDNEEEAFDWSQYSFYSATDCLPTHYWKPSSALCSPIASLSLTEQPDKCTVLSVIFSIPKKTMSLSDRRTVGDAYDYFSPVVQKIDGSFNYKAIGIMHLRHFLDDEPRPSPQDFMDRVFNELNCEICDFCIE